MDKSKKITIGLYALSIFLILGISYAYFSLNVIGNEDAKLSVVITGKLELTYTDNKEITLDNAIPGDSFQKEISVKNTGTLDTMYNIIWQELNNEFIKNEIVISATCERLNSQGIVDGTCNNIEEKPVARLSIPQKISIEAGITHKYTVTVKFIDTGKNQNYNQGKTFNGRLGIEEYKDNTPEATYCTFDGELTEGAEYVNGQYTYRYKQKQLPNDVTGDIEWQNILTDGWGVTLTDKTSTDNVTSKLCTYINDKPIVSMSSMFTYSAATEVDLSSFDTSNVTDMSYMFTYSNASSLNLSNFNTSNVTNMSYMFTYSNASSLNLSNFNTSNVTNMSYMFDNSKSITLDVSNFDTHNVTNMGYMFSEIEATTLNLSNFDTNKVTDMNHMFYNNKVTTLDLSNFDTSNVIDMSFMFNYSKATTIDVSSFNTSNAINMNYMFSDSNATIIDVSGFDTSKVTDMSHMFDNSKTTLIDVSNFDTSNVTDMVYMFSQTKATIIDVSNFDTSKVTDMRYMFYSNNAVSLNVSNFNTSNVTNMNSMFQGCIVTTLDLSNFDTSKVTDMNAMFNGNTKLKTIYASDKFTTDKVDSVSSMFYRCTSLVGGQGTTYNSRKVDKTYARIDGGTSSPGYFTSK